MKLECQDAHLFCLSVFGNKTLLDKNGDSTKIEKKIVVNTLLCRTHSATLDRPGIWGNFPLAAAAKISHHLVHLSGHASRCGQHIIKQKGCDTLRCCRMASTIRPVHHTAAIARPSVSTIFLLVCVFVVLEISFNKFLVGPYLGNRQDNSFKHF